MAKCFEAVGIDRLLTVDIHSLSAFQNSFRIPVDNLDSVKLFVDYLCGGTDLNGVPVDNHIDQPLSADSNNLVILSPDIGGMTRCSVFQSALEKRLNIEIPLAIFDKRRVDGKVTGSRIIGDVRDKKVIIFDDMIASGSTAIKAIDAIKQAGGSLYAFCATHGLFTGKAKENLAGVERLIVADTLPLNRFGDMNMNNIHIVPTARLIAQAIKRTHEEGGSISDLLKA